MLSHRECFYIRRFPPRRTTEYRSGTMEHVVFGRRKRRPQRAKSSSPSRKREMNLRIGKTDVVKKSGAATKSVKGKRVIYRKRVRRLGESEGDESKAGFRMCGAFSREEERKNGEIKLDGA